MSTRRRPVHQHRPAHRTAHRTAHQDRPARRSRGAVVGRALLAAGAALALAACAAIPTSGPVGEGTVEISDPGAVLPIAADDPSVDAPPDQIVREFLRAASAGLYDDFTVARKFLTVGASDSWDPQTEVLVYTGEPAVAAREDGAVVVVLRLAGAVDETGRYTEVVPGAAPRERTFTLREDRSGQWRIAQLDDGVLMSVANFRSQFRESEIYFASPDLTLLVPEVRWFPTRRVESSAVAALLAGPSPWLRDAVRSGAPEGARLQGDAVTVVGGVATVELTVDAGQAEAGDRALFQAQLDATLSTLSGRVNRVEVTVDDLPWARDDVLSLVRDLRPTTGPYVLADDALAVVERREVVRLEDAPSLAGLDAHAPALSPDLETRVVLDGPGRLVHLPVDGSPLATLHEGTELVAPTVDRFGWVWTAERTPDAGLVAVRPSGEEITVEAPWLAGADVHSMRVSRDGTRLAVAYTVVGESAVAVEVAGVVRDEADVPQRLSEDRLDVGAVLEGASELTWVDEVTLAVLGTAAEATGTGVAPPRGVHDVPLGGATSTLTPLEDVADIAGGRASALYALLGTGELFVHQGVSWLRVAEGVDAAVFPG